jgi:hypothetical protein
MFTVPLPGTKSSFQQPKDLDGLMVMSTEVRREGEKRGNNRKERCAEEVVHDVTVA